MALTIQIGGFNFEWLTVQILTRIQTQWQQLVTATRPQLTILEYWSRLDYGRRSCHHTVYYR